MPRCLMATIFAALSLITSILPTVAVVAQTDQWPAGQLDRSRLPSGRAIDYDFNDVQISTILGWLKRFNVEPPIALDGRVSGWLWAQAPARGWWRLGDYRVEGELNSPLLDVDRFSIRTARVRFGYLGGVWQVGQAQGQFESRGNGAADRRVLGQANISAQLPMSTSASAHAEGTLNGVPLIDLAATFGLRTNAPTGVARGNFELDTSLANLSRPLTWNARGSINAQQIVLSGLPASNLNTTWSLNAGQLTLPQTTIEVAGQRLQLTATVTLRDQFPFQLALPAQPIALTEPLFASLKLPSPEVLPTGNVQLALSTDGTLTPWSAAYALELSSPELRWLENILTNVRLSTKLTGAGLEVTQLQANVAGGRLAGGGVFPTLDDEPVSLQFNYQQIDLANVRGPSLPVMSGIVTGSGHVAIDRQQLQDFQALEFSLEGTGSTVRIADWGLGTIEYGLRKAADSRQLMLNIEDRTAGKRWSAKGQIAPDDGGDWNYDLVGQANQLDLSVAQLIQLTGMNPRLPVPLEILLATGTINVLGSTRTGVEQVKFDFERLVTLERDRLEWAAGSLRGRTTSTLIEISAASFKIGTGRVEGSWLWHRVAADGQLDRLRLTIENFALATLRAWARPDWALIEPESTQTAQRLPQPTALDSVEGVLNLSVDVQRPANADSIIAGWTGRTAMDVRDLNVRGQAIGNLNAQGDLSERRWQGVVEGNVLAAPLEGTVDVAVRREPSWSVERIQGNLTWVGAEAQRLLGLWQTRDKASQWSGLANLRSELDWQPGRSPSGFIDLEIPRLAYRSRNIVRELLISGRLENDQFRFARFDGSIAGGRVDVSGGYDFTRTAPVGVVVNFQRISLEEAVQLVDPSLAGDIQGRADLRARLTTADALSLSGGLRLRDANWSGLPISEAHCDFDAQSTPDWSLMRVHAANIRGRAFGGQLEGDLRARLSTRRDLNLRATIRRGDVEQLSQWSGTASVVGKGKFDAVLNLSAPRFQTVRDLQGRLDLSFEDTDARTLPVAGQLARFVPLFGLPSTEFERGELSANISRGDLRMRSLALWGRQLSVLGSGNVGLTSGGLDLQLVIRVGGGLSQQVAANYLTQLAAKTVPPVELILQINRLVANRAIFLRVGGTTGQPVIQPQTARIIEQALLRSLLEQAAPILSASLGVASGNTPGSP